MAKKQNKVKARRQPGKQRSFFKQYITHPKFVIFLLILLAIPVVSVTCEKYKDWDNAQMIRGIVRDFPLLLEEVERETGYSFEIRSDCSNTQEKYSSGAKTCELSVARQAEEWEVKIFATNILKSTKFKEAEYNQLSKAYGIAYRGNRSCVLSGAESIYFSCLVGVRGANVELAKEVFSKKY